MNRQLTCWQLYHSCTCWWSRESTASGQRGRGTFSWPCKHPNRRYPSRGTVRPQILPEPGINGPVSQKKRTRHISLQPVAIAACPRNDDRTVMDGFRYGENEIHNLGRAFVQWRERSFILLPLDEPLIEKACFTY